MAGRRGRRADVQDVARLPFLGFQAYRLEPAAAAAAAGSSFGSDSGSTGTRSRKLAQQSTNRLAVPAVTSSSGRPSGSPLPPPERRRDEQEALQPDAGKHQPRNGPQGGACAIRC